MDIDRRSTKGSVTLASEAHDARGAAGGRAGADPTRRDRVECRAAAYRPYRPAADGRGRGPGEARGTAGRRTSLRASALEPVAARPRDRRAGRPDADRHR